MPKFEIFKGTNGNYYFRLKASNGEIIAQSEGYSSKQGAQDGIASVKKNAPIAKNAQMPRKATKILDKYSSPSH